LQSSDRLEKFARSIGIVNPHFWAFYWCLNCNYRNYGAQKIFNLCISSQFPKQHQDALINRAGHASNVFCFIGHVELLNHQGNGKVSAYILVSLNAGIPFSQMPDNFHSPSIRQLAIGALHNMRVIDASILVVQ
jgi:hypothetical protein